MTFEQSFLLALPSILIALCGVLYQWYRDRNKPAVDGAQVILTKSQSKQIEAEITKQVMALANEQITDLSEQVVKLEAKVEEAEKGRILADERARLSDLRAREAEKKNIIYLNGIYILTNQLVTEGHKPQWYPSPTGPLAKPSEEPPKDTA